MKPFELETYIFIFYFETKKLSTNEKMVQNMVQKANPKVIPINKKWYKYTSNILYTFFATSCSGKRNRVNSINPSSLLDYCLNTFSRSINPLSWLGLLNKSSGFSANNPFGTPLRYVPQGLLAEKPSDLFNKPNQLRGLMDLSKVLSALIKQRRGITPILTLFCLAHVCK